MGQLDLITLDIHAIINKRFKMRTGYIVLLVALFVMVAMVGQSDATPQPEPVADPLPWPQYVWNVVKNIPSGAMGVFKASSENKEGPCTTETPPTTKNHHPTQYKCSFTNIIFFASFQF